MATTRLIDHYHHVCYVCATLASTRAQNVIHAWSAPSRCPTLPLRRCQSTLAQQRSECIAHSERCNLNRLSRRVLGQAEDHPPIQVDR